MRIASIFVLVSFLMSTFSQLIVLTGFVLNQDYIAVNLCENRTTPELDCKGRCQLLKEMKQDEKKHDQTSAPKSSEKEVSNYNEATIYRFYNPFNNIIQSYFYSINYSYLFYDKILKPPTVS